VPWKWLATPEVAGKTRHGIANSVFSGANLGAYQEKGLGVSRNVIEESERSFDPEMMGGASAEGCLLIELPYSFWGVDNQGEERLPPG
jgi:hypothetical protein